MIVASLTFTYQRSTVLDFVHMPVTVNRLVGMYYFDGANSLGWYFTKPFTKQIWCLLLGALLLSAITLAIIKYAQARFLNVGRAEDSLLATSLVLLQGAAFRQSRQWRRNDQLHILKL